jgi:hypothetical protein
MPSYWEVLPRDLQTLIGKIALTEERVMKLQRVYRANRPRLGQKYCWNPQTTWITPTSYAVGDTVVIQTRHDSEWKVDVGVIEKIGGSRWLYDCRIKVRNPHYGKYFPPNPVNGNYDARNWSLMPEREFCYQKKYYYDPRKRDDWNVGRYEPLTGHPFAYGNSGMILSFAVIKKQ